MKKARFRIGQVVMASGPFNGYYKITEVHLDTDTGTAYRMGHAQMIAWENELRPLTAREIGPRKRKGGKK